MAIEFHDSVERTVELKGNLSLTGFPSQAVKEGPQCWQKLQELFRLDVGKYDYRFLPHDDIGFRVLPATSARGKNGYPTAHLRQQLRGLLNPSLLVFDGITISILVGDIEAENLYGCGRCRAKGLCQLEVEGLVARTQILLLVRVRYNPSTVSPNRVPD